MNTLLATCNLSELTRVRFTTDGQTITVEVIKTDSLGVSRWDIYTEHDQIKPESELRALVNELVGQTPVARVLSEVSLQGDPAHAREAATYRLVQQADSELVIERRETDSLGGMAWRACARNWQNLTDEMRGDIAESLVLAIPRSLPHT